MPTSHHKNSFGNTKNHTHSVLNCIKGITTNDLGKAKYTSKRMWAASFIRLLKIIFRVLASYQNSVDYRHKNDRLSIKKPAVCNTTLVAFVNQA